MLRDRWMLAGLLFAIASGALACQQEQRNGVRQNMSVPAASQRLADLCAKTGLFVPPSAQLVGVEEDDRGEQYLRAKLVLSASEWAAFSERIPVPRDAMDRGTGGFLGQDNAWWDPHTAEGLETGQVEREAGVYLNIGVDESNPNAVSLYIVQHGT